MKKEKFERNLKISFKPVGLCLKNELGTNPPQEKGMVINMKKLFIFLLALMFTFTGCGSGEPPAAEPPFVEVPASEPAPEIFPEPAPEPEPEPEPAPSGPMHEPDKIYFHDTYNQLAENPSVMWGDFHWNGWFDVMIPLTHEENRWYSFEAMSGDIMDNYKMLIFFNGLPDEDPESIQWVWNSNSGFPNGRYFIADFANTVNPPGGSFAGEQRDALSFITFEEAEAATRNVIH
ncbi:MAG: hypothetical protein LBC86_10575 [Oscillospiraceae bacterium]|jgi:hypothetical protein|nr:hypothetical protein [Oscillospiraceae bacterium]